MTHLGDRASALVDGQLDPDGVERAHAHLAHCRGCRDLVDAERLLKARLATLQGPEPAQDLLGRLLAMGGPAGPLPPRSAHMPGSPRPPHLSVPSRGPGGSVRPVGAGQVGRLTVGPLAPSVRRGARRAVPLRRPGLPGVPGRSLGTRPGRARLAVAVVSALSVMGVGAAGLALSAVRGPAPSAPLDAFVVRQDAPTVAPTVAPAFGRTTPVVSSETAKLATSVTAGVLARQLARSTVFTRMDAAADSGVAPGDARTRRTAPQREPAPAGR